MRGLYDDFLTDPRSFKFRVLLLADATTSSLVDVAVGSSWNDFEAKTSTPLVAASALAKMSRAFCAVFGYFELVVAVESS